MMEQEHTVESLAARAAELYHEGREEAALYLLATQDVDAAAKTDAKAALRDYRIGSTRARAAIMGVLTALALGLLPPIAGAASGPTGATGVVGTLVTVAKPATKAQVRAAHRFVLGTVNGGNPTPVYTANCKRATAPDIACSVFAKPHRHVATLYLVDTRGQMGFVGESGTKACNLNPQGC